MNTIINIILKKYFNIKNKGLSKKNGDDKLVISLILIVIGCVLCFYYRDQVMDLMKKAIDTLSDKLDGLFNGLKMEH